MKVSLSGEAWTRANIYLNEMVGIRQQLHTSSLATTNTMPTVRCVGLLSLFIYIWVANPTPAPTPSPTRLLEPRATTCNADNCYRAAKSLNENPTGVYYNSIHPLCSSYTTPPTIVTSLTSSPLVLPSSCSAPRISSICDCLAPAQPCETRAAAQRVENPSFEAGNDGQGGSPYWTFTDTANNYALYNNNQQDYQGSWGL